MSPRTEVAGLPTYYSGESPEIPIKGNNIPNQARPY